jgi:hypothetical protein
MSKTSRGATHRTLAALAMMILGLGTALIGLASSASADSARTADMICHPVEGDTGGDTHAGYTIHTPDQTSSHLEADNVTPKHSADGGNRVDVLLGDDLLCPGEGPPEDQCPEGSVNGANPGDADGDGDSDADDCNFVEDQCPDSEDPNPGDANGDGTVDEADCDFIETLPTESTAPNDPSDPAEPEGDDPEVLGIAKKAPAPAADAPAAAPTAVAAGLDDESGTSGALWILLGGALALAGLTLGFVPATSRGKHTL